MPKSFSQVETKEKKQPSEVCRIAPEMLEVIRRVQASGGFPDTPSASKYLARSMIYDTSIPKLAKLLEKK